jgi:hypothetical protein
MKLPPIKPSQSVSFTASAAGTVRGSTTLTATGGRGGEPDDVLGGLLVGHRVCTVSGANGSTVTYTAAGSCVIDASQAWQHQLRGRPASHPDHHRQPGARVRSSSLAGSGLPR